MGKKLIITYLKRNFINGSPVITKVKPVVMISLKVQVL